MEGPIQKYVSSKFAIQLAFSLLMTLQEILDYDKVQAWF